MLLGFGKRMDDLFVDVVRSELEVKQRNQQLIENRAEIEAALANAVKANKSKSQFLAAASHDLSQPLHAMSIFIGNLKQSVAGDEKQRDLVQKIEASSEILKQQFDGLLDMSRYDAGGVTVQKEMFDLYALCRLLVQNEEIIGQQDDTEVVITGESLEVHSDPVLLGRLIGNLLSNAVKYTDNGLVELKLHQADDKVLLTVSDTGCGFPDADKTRIFGDFVQLGNSARNRDKGAGLGLSIVRRISELLEIKVEVKSRPGVGSEFTLSIPDVSTVASLHTGRSVSASRYLDRSGKNDQSDCADLDGESVLVVDDDLTILDALTEYVVSRNGKILAAGSVEEALNFYQTENISFAIVDDMLGEGKSGLDLASILADEIALNRIFIVTGNIEPERVKILRSSSFEVFSKPLSTGKLDEIISQRMGKQKGQVRA